MLENNSEEEKNPENEAENPVQKLMSEKKAEKPKRKIKVGRIIGYVIIAIIAVFIVVQLLSASYYKMTVNVVEGENVVGVNPTAEKLDFGDLSRGSSMTRYVTLKSAGKSPSYIIVWKFGGVASLVKVEKNYFTLNSSEEVKITFSLTIPPSAQIKHYNGQVIIFKLPKIF
ncbi:MAG: hypothetical protein PHW01_01155 [Patescibacteria group bacterium]|nr:hypothetical protein [Patescibacteria group bacterium]